jgi:hypothetical protein
MHWILPQTNSSLLLQVNSGQITYATAFSTMGLLNLQLADKMLPVTQHYIAPEDI